MPDDAVAEEFEPRITPPPPRTKVFGSHKAAPDRLLWSEGTLTGRAIGGSIALFIGTIGCVGGAVAISPSLQAAFTLQSSIFPLIIIYMLSLSVAMNSLRMKRLQDQMNWVPDVLLTTVERRLANDDLAAFSAELNSANRYEPSPYLRRLKALVDQWRRDPSAEQIDMIIQHHLVRDDEIVSAGYNLAKTFIWAMPMLGLIGTVVGISMATGNFANFLHGNADDVNLIKEQLGGVTSGLSLAFVITMVGLIGALLAMLNTMACQAKEMRFYSGVQDWVVNKVLPELQSRSDGPVSVNRAVQDTDRLSANFASIADAVALKIDRHVKASIEQINAQYENRHIDLQRMLGMTTSAMEKAISCTQTLTSLQDGLQQSLIELSSGKLADSVELLSRAVSGMTSEAHAASNTSGKLAESTEKVLDAQRGLQEAIAQLDSLGFASTLTGLRSSLDNMTPVLKRLSEPMIFRAVPLSEAEAR